MFWFIKTWRLFSKGIRAFILLLNIKINSDLVEDFIKFTVYPKQLILQGVH